MKTLALLVLSTTFACSKPADKSDPGSAAPAADNAPAAAIADRVEVLARHRPIAGKDDVDADPVIVHFGRFSVTKAQFNPKNLEGGTATIELDLTSIKTGSEERDGDLKSPAFIDVAKFATATIDVTNVKKRADATYIADAAVAFRGVTKTYWVTFEVLTTTADTVRIKGSHAFSRLDFSVGVDPAQDPTERVDTPLIIQWVLTLHTK